MALALETGGSRLATGNGPLPAGFLSGLRIEAKAVHYVLEELASVC